MYLFALSEIDGEENFLARISVVGLNFTTKTSVYILVLQCAN